MTSTSTTSSTSASSTTSTTTTTTSSTTTTTAPAFLEGRRLLLKDHPERPQRRRLLVIAKGAEIDLGAGPGSEDDPVANGGRLRMWLGDELVADYDLPAWAHLKKRRPERGYRAQAVDGIRSIQVAAGKVVRIVGRGPGLGHRLGETAPGPFLVELTLGASRRYCIEFGGAEKFKPQRKLLRKGSVRATRCAPEAAS